MEDKEINQEIVKKLLDYDPLTGKLYWKPRQKKCFDNKFAGKEAFIRNGKGYLYGKIFKNSYLAHRIIWLWMTGKFPIMIDHINHDRSDNRWINLREVTTQENAKNRAFKDKNFGVHFYKRVGKYRAFITNNYKNIHLGYYDNIEDAIAARQSAQEKYDFHKNHGKDER